MEVASAGPTDKLSVGMDRHQLAHSRPTAPMSPVGISQTPYIGWRHFLAASLINMYEIWMKSGQKVVLDPTQICARRILLIY